MLQPRLLVPLLLLALALPLRADDLPAAERKQRERVAATWLKLGKRALKAKLREPALACLAEARRAVGPKAAPVQAYAQACRRVSGEPRSSALASFRKQEARTKAKVAKLYDRLAGAKGVPPERRGLYAWEALRLEPSPERWEGLAPALQAAWRGGAREAAGEAAREALELDPPADAQAALAQLERLGGVGKVVLRQAKAHPMRYYLALPDDYDPAAETAWPVLVTVDGAGSGFQGTAKAYANLVRKQKLPCVVVAPCGFANTNAIQGKMKEKYLRWYDEATIAKAEQDRHAFDLAGLEAVLAELRADFGVAAQVCITGFSGGGNLTYQMIFKRPERLLAAAPACANFSRPGWAEGERSADARALPIHVITGGKDPHREWTHGKKGSPGIEPQTDAAMAALKRAGLTRVKRTLIPDLKHSPARQQVLDFFGPYLRGEKERGDPWP